jgi:Aminoglycoside-2''-adenylyltransferase
VIRPRPRNDLSFVLRVVDLLESARLRTWLFGGWAEELAGLAPPREHADIDLLFPGRDFARVDRFLAHADVEERVGKRFPHKRAFELDGVLVELFLVERDERGWFTALPSGRHDWPPDVFTAAGRLPVVSPSALTGYRAARSAGLADRAA